MIRLGLGLTGMSHGDLTIEYALALQCVMKVYNDTIVIQNVTAASLVVILRLVP